MPEADTKALIQQGQPGLEQLQQFDQLYNEQKSRRAFMGFTEGPLSFAPTYKFDVGTNSYDSSEKRRAPAWCDRILYFKNPIVATAKTTDGSDDGYVQWLKLVWYGSCMDFLLSDHKPVLAEFEAKVQGKPKWFALI